MCRSHLKPILSPIILLLTLCVTHIEAQEAASTLEEEARAYVVNDETYYRVLDIVFPRQVLVGSLGYAFVLRFRPPFDDAESQITILNKAGRIEVMEYRAVDGNILKQLNNIFERTRKQDVAAMAKQIQVEKRPVILPPDEVARLRQSFHDRVCQSVIYEKKQVDENMQEQTLMFDGTGYLLWYRGEEESFYSLASSGLDSPPPPKEHPLVSWMREVNNTLRKFLVATKRKT